MIKDRKFVETTPLPSPEVEKYPHFVKKLEFVWGEKECRQLIDSVMINDRGNRQGFAPGAMSEIAFLSALCDVRDAGR